MLPASAAPLRMTAAKPSLLARRTSWLTQNSDVRRITAGLCKGFQLLIQPCLIMRLNSAASGSPVTVIFSFA